MARSTESGKPLSRGRLARHVGISAETIRFYERIGLLPKPQRAANGYRVYDDTDVLKLRLVLGARAFGFSLKEIGGFLAQLDRGNAGFADVRRALQLRTESIERQIAALKRQRADLERFLRDWERSACPVKKRLLSGPTRR
ncbi:MAG: MerR family transcriptional regulator [Myxococcales bacterium]